MPTIVTRKKIKEVVDKIAKEHKPEKIILFGSYAWGKPGKDSDLDLFIVKKTKEDPWKSLYKIRSSLDDINESFDIIVYTPRQVKERLALGDYFVEDVIKKGKVIYEKRR